MACLRQEHTGEQCNQKRLSALQPFASSEKLLGWEHPTMTGARNAGIYAVVFEVKTTAELYSEYLAIAARLRPMLDDIAGFQSIERSRSLEDEHSLLSLSFWADEAALVQWRSAEQHYAAQESGRERIFEDYRLRVGRVFCEDALTDNQVAVSPPAYNVPPHHERKFMALAQIDEPSGADALTQWLASFERLGGKAYRSIVNATRYFVTIPLQSATHARELIGTDIRQVVNPERKESNVSIRLIEVERDYGMEDRGQAPQFFRKTREA